MNQDNILGNNIRFLRLKKKWSLNDLAGLLDLKGQTGVAGYEYGSNNPSLERLIKLSELFDITLDELVFTKLYERQSRDKEIMS